MYIFNLFADRSSTSKNSDAGNLFEIMINNF